MLKKIAALACALTVALASCTPQSEPEVKELRKPAGLEVTEMTADAITVTWNAVENATSYACTISGGTAQTTEATTYTFTGLTAGTEYTIEVVAKAEGYEDSPASKLTITLKESTGSNDDYVGEWTLTSEAYFTWEPKDDGYLYSATIAESITRTLKIEDMYTEYPDYVSGPGEVYLITGFSELAPTASLQAMYYEDYNGLIVFATQMSDFNENGYCTAWLPLAEFSEVNEETGEEELYVYPVAAMLETGIPVFLFAFEEGSTTNASFQSLLVETDEGEVPVVGTELYAYFEDGSMQIFSMDESGTTFAKSPIGYTIPCVKNGTKASSFDFVPQWNNVEISFDIRRAAR